MTEVRQRLGVVQSVLAGKITTGHPTFNAELMFVQLRKTLELIAFGSLSANKVKYSETHENFAKHWKAKAMLDALEKVNPDFYPVPLDPPQQKDDGTKYFPRPADGFMTRDEFASLYDSCGKVLHTRNPFSTEDPTIKIGYTVEQWVARVQRLLDWHVVQLLGGDRWIVNIPSEGDVRAWSASPLV